MFERQEKIFVELLGFLACLLEQTLPLHIGIVQLGVTGRHLHAVDDELVNIHESWVVQVLFRERHQFFRTMGHEQRIERFFFH